jgi:hypothetical protein
MIKDVVRHELMFVNLKLFRSDSMLAVSTFQSHRGSAETLAGHAGEPGHRASVPQGFC